MYELFLIERRRKGNPEVESSLLWTPRFGSDRDEKVAVVKAMLAKAVKKNRKKGKGDLSFLVYHNGDTVEGACAHDLTVKEYNAQQKRINRATEAWAEANE